MSTETQLANLNRAGRKPAFTPEIVHAVLHFRKYGAPEPMTAARFLQLALAEGVLPKAVHPSTILRLFKGKLFPQLLDPDTGREYDYSQLPKFFQGRPPTIQRAVDPVTGAPLKRLSKGREQLKHEIMVDLRSRMDRDVSFMIGQIRKGAVTALEEEVKTLRDEFNALKFQVMHPLKEVK